MNDEDKITYFKRYCDKLIIAIQHDKIIELFGKCFVDKKMLDDLICCLDANMPRAFSDFRNHFGDVDGRIKTNKLYKQMIKALKSKVIFGNSIYVIKKFTAMGIITQLKWAIREDYLTIKKIAPDL